MNLKFQFDSANTLVSPRSFVLHPRKCVCASTCPFGQSEFDHCFLRFVFVLVSKR